MGRKSNNRAILMGVFFTLILAGCNSSPGAKPQAVSAAQPSPVQQLAAQSSPAEEPRLEGVGFHGGESRESVASRMSQLGFQAENDCDTNKGASSTHIECNFTRNKDEKVVVGLDNGSLSNMTYTFNSERFSSVLEQLTKTLGAPSAPRSDDGPSDRYWCKDPTPSATCHVTVMLIRDESPRVVLIVQPSTNGESKLAEPFPVPRIQSASEVSQEKKGAAVECYNNNLLVYSYHQSAQHRRDYALNAAPTLAQAYPSMHNMSAGHDDEYLLFVADPADEGSLREMLELFGEHKDWRGRACIEGFKEVQFITRDDNYQQKLIGRIKPTWEDFAETYAKAHAHPMN